MQLQSQVSQILALKPPPRDALEEVRLGWCAEVLLLFEGGKANDLNDRGGATRFGISSRFHPGFNPRGPAVEVWARALEVYSVEYWRANKCHLMPLPVALATFDFAVHSDARIVRKALQRVVGAKQDGAIGPKTLAKIRRRDAHEVAMRLVLERVKYLVKGFRGGWFTKPRPEDRTFRQKVARQLYYLHGFWRRTVLLTVAVVRA